MFPYVALKRLDLQHPCHLSANINSVSAACLLILYPSFSKTQVLSHPLMDWHLTLNFQSLRLDLCFLLLGLTNLRLLSDGMPPQTRVLLSALPCLSHVLICLPRPSTIVFSNPKARHWCVTIPEVSSLRKKQIS
jgi:hypothetical protein